MRGRAGICKGAAAEAARRRNAAAGVRHVGTAFPLRGKLRGAVQNRQRWRKPGHFHLIRRAAGRARAETRLPACVTSGNTSSGGQSPPPSPQGEGIAIRRCRIPFEAGLAPSGSPAAQIPFHHTPFGCFSVLCKLFAKTKAQKPGRSGCGTAWFDFVMSTCIAYVNRFRCRARRSKRRTGRG